MLCSHCDFTALGSSISVSWYIHPSSWWGTWTYTSTLLYLPCCLGQFCVFSKHSVFVLKRITFWFSLFNHKLVNQKMNLKTKLLNNYSSHKTSCSRPQEGQGPNPFFIFEIGTQIKEPWCLNNPKLRARSFIVYVLPAEDPESKTECKSFIWKLMQGNTSRTVRNQERKRKACMSITK